ncbi:MAG: hypothetical protein LBF64_06785, partial [Oscillospiraceae bacterium]|nr:hypothetical protein [Oscillospiraceae bacterium]
GGYCGGASWSSSNVVEREIVFGGQDRLSEQIRSTLDLMDGDLYVVITGCMVEMIGDDVQAVAEAFADEAAPVVAIPTPSFKGNSYEGYDMVLSGLFRHFTRPAAAARPDTVNLLGLVPGQDAFYKGNLAEIKRLLTRLGLRVRTFFGEGETLRDLQSAAEAAHTLVLSDVYGVKSAQVLESLHGIPHTVLPLPVGAAQTGGFLRAAADALHVERPVAEAVIQSEETRYYDYLERLADIYNDIDLQRYAVIAGDANYAPAVSRFLADELGWLPVLSVVTDFLDEAQTRSIERRFDTWESGLKPLVRFDTDTSSLERHLRDAWPPNANERYYDSLSPTVLVGTVFERDLAARFGWPLLTVSFPMTNRVVLQQAYAGYNGGLTLTSDLLTLLISGR